MNILKSETTCMKEEASETRAELNARKWRQDEQAVELTRISDWFQTQIRSVETFIGRVRRETFDCRLKFKRGIERDVSACFFSWTRELIRCGRV